MHPSNSQLASVLRSAKDGQRSAQKDLYKHYYSYAMSICMRYASTREDAVEVMNDGFLKAFKYLHKFDMDRAFQPWFRRIMINCAIDRFKKDQLHLAMLEMTEKEEIMAEQPHHDQVSYDEMLDIIRELPPAYRTVFNLHAIEGYKHEEIATMLGISVGTSKSNYAKARVKLQVLLNRFFEIRQ